MVIDYVAFPCVDDVGNRGEREESSSSSDAFAQFSHCVEGDNLSLGLPPTGEVL